MKEEVEEYPRVKRLFPNLFGKMLGKNPKIYIGIGGYIKV